MTAEGTVGAPTCYVLDQIILLYNFDRNNFLQQQLTIFNRLIQVLHAVYYLVHMLKTSFCLWPRLTAKLLPKA
jgi:hypothetical protein